MIVDVQIFKDELKQKLDAVYAWAADCLTKEPLTEAAPPKAAPPKEHRRLHRRIQLFAIYYEKHFGKKYVVQDLAEEGGAAKRTEAKANFYEYRDGLRKYFEFVKRNNLEPCGYLFFIRWFSIFLWEKDGK